MEMNKQQIIEYLNAVCDAESVIQSCNDTIEVYKQEKYKIHKPSMPVKPVMKSVFEEKVSLYFGLTFWVLSLKLWGFFGLIIMGITRGNYEALRIWAIVAAVVAIILAETILYFNDKAKKEKEYTVKLGKEKARYLLECQQYQKQCRIREIKDEISAMLDAAIQQELLHKQEAAKKLEQLYQRNILHSDFQNIIAVYQIRKYLQMGICDSLEGANGAYAQYMLDVSTKRIYASIVELKLEIAVPQRKDILIEEPYNISPQLIEELHNINQSIENARIAIQNGTSVISSKLETMQRESVDQIEVNSQDARQILSNMKENIAVSAHNQYVEQRMNGVEGYLLRHPVD